MGRNRSMADTSVSNLGLRTHLQLDVTTGLCDISRIFGRQDVILYGHLSAPVRIARHSNRMLKELDDYVDYVAPKTHQLASKIS